jgi:hypothetical protein
LTIEINGEPFDFMMVIREVQAIRDDIEAGRVATKLIDQARDQLLVELAAIRRERAVRAQATLRASGLKVDAANRQLADEFQTSVTTVRRMILEAGQYGVASKQ